MKKLSTLIAILICFTNLKAQYVTIPDANFVNWLQTIYPSCMSGNQMDTTCTNIVNATSINISGLNIADLSGIKYFKNLQSLDCQNNQFTSITLLPNSITHLYCSGNSSLTTISDLPASIYKFECLWSQLSNLPTLPSSLRILSCWGNQLTNLPPLPNLLEELNCDRNLISTLPILPNSLTELTCGMNQISTLPSLPNNLKVLDCYSNQITSIPTLPSSLEILSCAYNLLSSLPNIPNSVSEISCERNNITNLPSLPNNLALLRCSHNQLTSLPTLPNMLGQLFCDSNQITNIPIFPTSLDELNCSNNYINCFPTFPQMSIIDISNNFNNCLPNYIPSMDLNTLAYPLCNSGFSNGCPNAQGIVGYIYKDNNSNCVKDNGDSGIKNIRIKIYNNTNLLGQTYSALNGVYGFPQTANNYSVIIDTLYLPYYSPCIYPGLDSSFTVSQLDTNINFSLLNKPGFDLGIQSINVSGVVFPGLSHTLIINAGDFAHWYNLNTTAGVTGSVSFSVYGPVTYIGPAPGSLTPSVSGNVYTYNVPDFGVINNTNDFKLIFQTDTIAQSGDSICIYASINSTIGDNNLTNNLYNYCYQVVNSYDPNIKEVYPIDVQPGFNDWLTYTIHFQNTGNAPAYNIRLADTLDAMLDLETFQVINYSHFNNTSVNGNVLNVRFPNIMLPDSTSNPSGSIGYIQYRIKPKATWVAPYKIKNTAYIYFDYNAPIVTNTTYNSILVPTSLNNQSETLSRLYPNPTNGTFTIELNTKEKQQMQLFDITGNVVLSQNIENGKAIIDANHLAAGIYNISITGTSSITNKKLAIVK